MPIVPVYEGGVGLSRESLVLRDATLNPNEFGAGLAAALGEQGEVLARRARELKNQQDALKAQQTFRQHEERVRKALLSTDEAGAPVGLKTWKGSEAIGATRAGLGVLDALEKEADAALENDDQRRAFKGLWGSLRASTAADLGAHEYRETQLAREAESKAAESSYLETAHATDPVAQRLSLDRVGTQYRANHPGLPQEHYDEVSAGLFSRGLYRRFAWLEAQDPGSARTFLEQWGGALRGDEALKAKDWQKKTTDEDTVFVLAREQDTKPGGPWRSLDERRKAVLESGKPARLVKAALADVEHQYLLDLSTKARSEADRLREGTPDPEKQAALVREIPDAALRDGVAAYLKADEAESNARENQRQAEAAERVTLDVAKALEAGNFALARWFVDSNPNTPGANRLSLTKTIDAEEDAAWRQGYKNATPEGRVVLRSAENVKPDQVEWALRWEDVVEKQRDPPWTPKAEQVWLDVNRAYVNAHGDPAKLRAFLGSADPDKLRVVLPGARLDHVLGLRDRASREIEAEKDREAARQYSAELKAEAARVANQKRLEGYLNVNLPKLSGIKATDKRYPVLLRAALAGFYASAPQNEQEIGNLVDGLMLEGEEPGTLWDSSKRLFEVGPGKEWRLEGVPSEYVGPTLDYLHRKHPGKTITAEDVTRQYGLDVQDPQHPEHKKGKAAGAASSQGVREMPVIPRVGGVVAPSTFLEPSVLYRSPLMPVEKGP